MRFFNFVAIIICKIFFFPRFGITLPNKNEIYRFHVIVETWTFVSQEEAAHDTRCALDNFILRIRICFKLAFVFVTGGGAGFPLEMDLFAFVDIIGIRAIGFPVVLPALRSYYFPSRRVAPFPQRENQ